MVYLHDRGVVRKDDEVLIRLMNAGILAVVIMGAIVVNSILA